MTKKTAFTIILSILFTLGVTTVAIFASFLDNTDVRPSIVKADTLTYKERKDYTMNKAFKDVEETKSLSVLFSEDEFNLFINSYIKEHLKESNGACFTFRDNGNIYMEFAFKLGGIKTVVRAELHGTVTDKNIDIVLSNVKIGKTGGALTKMLFTEKNIKKIFLENNIFASYNDKTATISFSREQLKQTFKSFYQASENADLYAVLMNRAFSESDMVDIVWCKNGKFGAVASLTKLEYNASINGNIPYNISFETVKEKVVYLLNNGIITTKQADIVFKFIIQGYKLLKDEEKLDIDKINLSSIGISQNALYKGVLAQYEQSVTEIIATQLKNISLTSLGSIRLSVDSNSLNNIFVRVPVIGQGSLYCVKGEGGYVVSCVAVESMYFKIVKDNINITLIVNLNGFKMAVSCDFFGYSSSDLTFTVDLKTTKIGTLITTDEENKSLMKFLKTAFATEDWIICDLDKQNITFDFEKVIDNQLFSTLFKFGFTVKVSALNGNNGTGYLAIDLGSSIFR